jgi:hypothetical protein
MRIRAVCRACERDFLFFELRTTTGVADRCPNCDRFLGARGILAVRAEQALAVLVGSLDELARHGPNFTVHASTVLTPVENALTELSVPPTADPASPPNRPWQRRRAA